VLAGSFWLQKITTNPHIIADVNIECPDDPKLKIYISEIILYSYEYMPVAYIRM